LLYVSAAPGPGTMTGVKLPSVTAIADMVAPVVLIAASVLLANGLLSTYTAVMDRIRTLKRQRLHTPGGEGLHEIDRQLATMVRRVRLLHGAVLVIFGGIALLVLSVVAIAMAEVHNSETQGAVALGLVIAGTIAMLAGLLVVAIAYAARRGF
jgi:Protein of unknown function (DUF2721)